MAGWLWPSTLLLLLLLQDLSKLSLTELEAELARRKNAQQA